MKLKEFVDKNGNKININSSTTQKTSKTSSKTNKKRFKELTDYMVAHTYSRKPEVFGLDDYGFTYKELASTGVWGSGRPIILTVVVHYGSKRNPASTVWKCEYYADTELIKKVKGDGIEKLVQALYKEFNFTTPKQGSPEYKSICESISSFAEEFKLYETMWNIELTDVDEDEPADDVILTSYPKEVNGKVYDLLKADELRAAMEAANDTRRALWLRNAIYDNENGWFTKEATSMAVRVWREYKADHNIQ